MGRTSALQSKTSGRDPNQRTQHQITNPSDIEQRSDHAIVQNVADSVSASLDDVLPVSLGEGSASPSFAANDNNHDYATLNSGNYRPDQNQQDGADHINTSQTTPKRKRVRVRRLFSWLPQSITEPEVQPNSGRWLPKNFGWRWSRRSRLTGDQQHPISRECDRRRHTLQESLVVDETAGPLHHLADEKEKQLTMPGVLRSSLDYLRKVSPRTELGCSHGAIPPPRPQRPPPNLCPDLPINSSPINDAHPQVRVLSDAGSGPSRRTWAATCRNRLLSKVGLATPSSGNSQDPDPRTPSHPSAAPTPPNNAIRSPRPIQSSSLASGSSDRLREAQPTPFNSFDNRYVSVRNHTTNRTVEINNNVNRHELNISEALQPIELNGSDAAQFGIDLPDKEDKVREEKLPHSPFGVRHIGHKESAVSKLDPREDIEPYKSLLAEDRRYRQELADAQRKWKKNAGTSQPSTNGYVSNDNRVLEPLQATLLHEMEPLDEVIKDENSTSMEVKQKILAELTPRPLRIVKTRQWPPLQTSSNDDNQTMYSDPGHKTTGISYQDLPTESMTAAFRRGIAAAGSDGHRPGPSTKPKIETADQRTDDGVLNNPFDTLSTYTDKSIAESVLEDDPSNTPEGEEVDTSSPVLESLLSLLGERKENETTFSSGGRRYKSLRGVKDTRQRAVSQDLPSRLPGSKKATVHESLPKTTLIPRPTQRGLIGLGITFQPRHYNGHPSTLSLLNVNPRRPNNPPAHLNANAEQNNLTQDDYRSFIQQYSSSQTSGPWAPVRPTSSCYSTLSVKDEPCSEEDTTTRVPRRDADPNTVVHVQDVPKPPQPGVLNFSEYLATLRQRRHQIQWQRLG